MKKHLVKFTLMLLAIALGVSNAFAEDVYKKLVKKIGLLMMLQIGEQLICL